MELSSLEVSSEVGRGTRTHVMSSTRVNCSQQRRQWQYDSDDGQESGYHFDDKRGGREDEKKGRMDEGLEDGKREGEERTWVLIYHRLLAPAPAAVPGSLPGFMKSAYRSIRRNGLKGCTIELATLKRVCYVRSTCSRERGRDRERESPGRRDRRRWRAKKRARYLATYTTPPATPRTVPDVLGIQVATVLCLLLYNRLVTGQHDQSRHAIELQQCPAW